MKFFWNILYPNQRPKAENGTSRDATQPVTIKKLGPGEVMMIKGCRAAEIYNMYGLKRLP